MHLGGVDPPGNPHHETGSDPPAGQQKLELLDYLRETLAFPTVSPLRRISSLPLTSAALVPQRMTRHLFRHSFATHGFNRAPAAASSPADHVLAAVRQISRGCGREERAIL